MTTRTAYCERRLWPTLHMTEMPQVGDRIVNEGSPAMLWGTVVSLTTIEGMPHRRVVVLRWGPPPAEKTEGDVPPEGIVTAAMLCVCEEVPSP